MTDTRTDTRIAVIGMACRVPGASTLQALWANVVDCADSIAFLFREPTTADLAKFRIGIAGERP